MTTDQNPASVEERVARHLAARDWLTTEDRWNTATAQFRADYLAAAREVIALAAPAAVPVPPPADRAAVLPLTAAERQFLTFALDQAADHLAFRPDEFTDEDRAAMEALRRMAAEEQPAGHACRNCEGIDPGTCLMNPDRPKPPPMDPVHILGIDAAPERPAVGEQPETQETP